MSPIRVVVVTNRPSTELTVTHAIETSPDVTLQGLTTPDPAALLTYATFHPDIVILDTDPARLNAEDTIRALHGAYPQTKILVYAPTPEHLNTMLMAGASGYLLDKTSPQDLLEAIRSAHAGKTVVSLGLMRHLLGFPDKHSHNFHS